MDPEPIDTARLQPEALYHLATAQEWEAYQSAGAIEPSSLATEGFVHCSWGHQVAGTVQRHFSNVAGLLAIQLDPDALGTTALAEEDSYGSGQAFPHAYGVIPLAAVLRFDPVA